MFLRQITEAFLVRTEPDSSMVKPAHIHITKAPQTRNEKLLRTNCDSASSAAWGLRGKEDENQRRARGAERRRDSAPAAEARSRAPGIHVVHLRYPPDITRMRLRRPILAQSRHEGMPFPSHPRSGCSGHPAAPPTSARGTLHQSPRRLHGTSTFQDIHAYRRPGHDRPRGRQPGRQGQRPHPGDGRRRRAQLPHRRGARGGGRGPGARLPHGRAARALRCRRRAGGAGEHRASTSAT